ncbi:MAG TPA: DUF433 domain-containing protein [Candidatus Binataceae bacterium]|nr:DUF433 domain-containing protein [Candidatus Binataceae bacterium]
MREVSESGYRLIGHGVNTIPEAARLTRIAAPRIRRWLRGYEHRIGGELRRSPPMIQPTFGLIDGMVAISFLDLVEIRFINAFVEQGVTWAYLRKAHERAVEIVGHFRPFSTRTFKTDGRRILTEIVGTCGSCSTLDVGAGQLGFWPMIAPFYKQLDFDADEASRWWPHADRKVVIDPQRSFGQPIVARDGIPTRTLYRAYLAENQEIGEVASCYGISRHSVRSAVEFEERLTA